MNVPEKKVGVDEQESIQLPPVQTIFILCEHSGEGKQGILILDKQAFPENKDDVQKCIEELRLIHLSNNSVYGNFHVELPAEYNLQKSTLIYPATETHIKKYRFKPLHLVFETADDYRRDHAAHHREDAWVYNYFGTGREKEQDLILFKDEDPQNGFLLLRDLKWSGLVLEQLYYQAIIIRRDIKSVRDLTEKELPLLKNILAKCTKAIFDKHGIPESKLKIHFHYQPSYYHLHVHFRFIGSEADQPFIHLQQAIANIELIPDYYQKATLSCVLKEDTPLYDAFKAAGRL
ncbi:M7GpppX diphosphatase [Aphelenchoides fujianensis]|nr:M7GpppX diphosphatase [Aphelenchoides fujianensis]